MNSPIPYGKTVLNLNISIFIMIIWYLNGAKENLIFYTGLLTLTIDQNR